MDSFYSTTEAACNTSSKATPSQKGAVNNGGNVGCQLFEDMLDYERKGIKPKLLHVH